MGVYIKDMEMPTNTDMAPTAVWVYPNGYAVVFKDNGKMQQYTQAVSVQPHGDLIDRDALISNHTIDQYDWSEVIDVEDIRNAPTIIPASE